MPQKIWNRKCKYVITWLRYNYKYTLDYFRCVLFVVAVLVVLYLHCLLYLCHIHSLMCHMFYLLRRIVDSVCGVFFSEKIQDTHFFSSLFFIRRECVFYILFAVCVFACVFVCPCPCPRDPFHRSYNVFWIL